MDETRIYAMSLGDDVIFTGRERNAIDSRGGGGIDSARRQLLVDGLQEDEAIYMPFQFFSFCSFQSYAPDEPFAVWKGLDNTGNTPFVPG